MAYTLSSGGLDWVTIQLLSVEHKHEHDYDLATILDDRRMCCVGCPQ